MAEIEEQHLISKEWTVEVKNFLTAGEEAAAVGRSGVRLPKSMMNAKAEAYIPEMVSLGPYHHRILKDESAGPFHRRLTNLSQMEVYKLKATREAANPDFIRSFFAKIIEPQIISQFQQFYDWKIEGTEEIEKFAWMMIVDAFFLFQFLKNTFDFMESSASSISIKPGRTKSSNNKNSDMMPALASIRCDIVKLENQMPLFLVKEIDKALNTRTVEIFLQHRIARLSSFQVNHDQAGGKKEQQQQNLHLSIKQIHDEKHLLSCMHTYVSSFLRVEDRPREQTCREMIIAKFEDLVAALFSICFGCHPAKTGLQDFLHKYNATELAKAGVKFQSFREGPGSIRFDKHSATLYLPRIIISDTYTEVLLRNLLALEFNDVSREKSVTQYVELMDCLIDTPDDVALLRKCHVIVRESMMITDEYVAKMWDGMSRPFFFGGFLEHDPRSLKAEIREVLIANYYKSKIRTAWSEFSSEHLSRPWKALALLVAIFIVFLTTLQTYCSVKDC